MDKRKIPFDDSEFVDLWDTTMPQQNNGCDCGVFTCQTMEHRARGIGNAGQGSLADVFEFKQEDIRGIRRMMVWEIKNHKLVERGQVVTKAKSRL